jgi:hypothetical protein
LLYGKGEVHNEATALPGKPENRRSRLGSEPFARRKNTEGSGALSARAAGYLRANEELPEPTGLGGPELATIVD